MLAVARVTSIISEVRVEFVFAKALCSTLSLFTQVYIWEGLSGLTDSRKTAKNLVDSRK